ncbi:DUF4282 domain-containing protein [Neokomagataea anthophila]|uniref:DUF4282 domain-containing protein n=1 Tax=Neokomagataea anthophila TaxID=2826925 RepID=A0ABS5E9M0_9PROT|nr:DUF4282 domain-containing protein [Neokomagataea anthophila]MBR0560605.1 DUF4282 domain-containing protein [Neokomagataea anthophila]
MRSIFSFENLITPTIIKILFYIGVVLCCLSGFATLSTIITSMIASAELTGHSTTLAGIGGLFLGLIVGSIVTVIGVILTRISCELTLVIFMIRDELAWQREHHSNNTSSSPE